MVTRKILESLLPPLTSILVKSGRVIKKPYTLARGNGKEDYPIYISYGMGVKGHQLIYDMDIIEHIVSEEEVREALLDKLTQTKEKLEEQVAKLSRVLGEE